MRRRALLGVLVLGLASPSGANILDAWTRIELQFTNLARASASDTGIGVATVNNVGSTPHIASLSLTDIPGLSINAILPVTDPAVSSAGIVSIRVDAVRPNIAGTPGPKGAPGLLGSFATAIHSTGTPPGGVGTIPSTGMVRICLLSPGCASNLALDLGKTVNDVAQGVGVGGILTIGQLGTIRVSILGAPYTVKTVTAFNRTNNGGIDTYTDKGFAHGPLSNTCTTGQTSGVLQIVSASHTSVVGVPGNNDISGSFSRVLVHFVPEPAPMGMLGGVALVLAWLGRARSRR
jgi:hypothetical protein